MRGLGAQTTGNSMFFVNYVVCQHMSSFSNELFELQKMIVALLVVPKKYAHIRLRIK